jgi:hypothetical protein
MSAKEIALAIFTGAVIALGVLAVLTYIGIWWVSR